MSSVKNIELMSRPMGAPRQGGACKSLSDDSYTHTAIKKAAQSGLFKRGRSLELPEAVFVVAKFLADTLGFQQLLHGAVLFVVLDHTVVDIVLFKYDGIKVAHL